MRIVKYTVRGLFDTYKHEINLSEEGNVRIILGQNGIGKTVMLKMLNAFFSYDVEEIQKYKFDTIEIMISDGQRIEIRNEQSDIIVSLQNKTKKESESFAKILEAKEHALIKARSILSKESYRRIDDNFWLNRLTGELVSTEELIILHSDLYPQLKMLNIHGYPIWLDNIVKAVHVEMIDTKRLQSRVSVEREGLSRISWEVGDTVKVYAKDFLRRLEQAKAEANKVAAELDRTYPNRLIESFGQYETKQTINSLIKNLKLLNEKRSKLVNAGLMEHAKDEVLSRNFNLNDKISVALNIYLEDSNKKLEAYTDMLNKVNLLMDLINNRFLNKKLLVDASEGLIIKSTITKEVIDLNKLSSGEQHLFILYYYMLFKYHENTLLLLDEPEISLHITWQKKFISDIIKINELNPMNVLIATHAPSIVRDYWSITQILTPKEN